MLANGLANGLVNGLIVTRLIIRAALLYCHDSGIIQGEMTEACPQSKQ